MFFLSTCNAGFDQHQGIRQALVAFFVGKINGKIAADGIQLLTGGHLLLENDWIPAEAEDGRGPCLPGLFNGGGNNFLQELIRIGTKGYRSDNRQGNANGVMGVTIAATGHHKALASVVNYFGLAGFNIGFGAFLVAHIHKLAVFHRKGLCHRLFIGRENLAINHKVGFYKTLIHRINLD